MKWLLAAIAVAGCGANAHRPERPLSHAVSISLPALATRTLAGSYEYLPRQLPQASIALSSGLRFGAAGDYSSRTFATSAEGRYWITGAPWFRRADRRQMMGFYAGFRLGVARTTTHFDDKSGAIGETLALSEALTVGYRLILFRRFELTASQGVAIRHEFDRKTGLPPWTQAGFTFGATAGWLF